MIVDFFLFVVLIIIVVLLILNLNKPEPQLDINYIPKLPSSFLGYCEKDEDCEPDYKCNKTTRECKSGKGNYCLGRGDCLDGLRCSGICITPFDKTNLESNQPEDFCPCRSGFICANLELEGTKCLLPEGSSCLKSSQCLSNDCQFDSKVCGPLAEVGSKCKYNFQCLEGNCGRDGVCQPPGIIAGKVGSYCDRSTSFCDPGLNCSPENNCSDKISGLNEDCSSSSCAGILRCYYADKGFGQNFSSDIPNNIINVKSGVGKFLCSFQGTGGGPKPNSTQIQGQCLSDFTGPDCKLKSQKPCFNDGFCNSDKCNSGSFIYRLKPLGGDCYPGNGVNGSSDVTWEQLTNRPLISNSIVNKMVAITLNYLVVSTPNCKFLPQGQDQIYCLTLDPDGKAYIQLFDGSKWTLITNPTLDPNGNSNFTVRTKNGGQLAEGYNITSFDVTVAEGKPVVMCSMIFKAGTSGEKTILATLENGNFTTFNLNNFSGDGPGTQYDSSGGVIKIRDVSARYFETSNGLSVLISDGTSLYNNSAITFYSKVFDVTVSQLSLGGINLNQYLVNTSGSVVESFPMITYLEKVDSSAGSDTVLRFSKSLFNSDGGYSNIIIPESQSVTASVIPRTQTTIKKFAFSTSDQRAFGSQSGIMIINKDSVNYLAYLFKGTIIAIPGYVNDSSLVSQSGLNSYLLTTGSCS